MSDDDAARPSTTTGPSGYGRRISTFGWSPTQLPHWCMARKFSLATRVASHRRLTAPREMRPADGVNARRTLSCTKDVGQRQVLVLRYPAGSVAGRVNDRATPSIPYLATWGELRHNDLAQPLTCPPFFADEAMLPTLGRCHCYATRRTSPNRFVMSRTSKHRIRF